MTTQILHLSSFSEKREDLMIADTPVGTKRVEREPTRQAAATPHTLTKSRYRPKSSGQSDKWRKRLRFFLGQGECVRRDMLQIWIYKNQPPSKR